MPPQQKPELYFQCNRAINALRVGGDTPLKVTPSCSVGNSKRWALLQWAICCRVVSPHHPQQPGSEDHLLRFPKEHDGAIPHHVKQLLHEVLQIWQPMQLLDHPPTGSNTVPPPKKKHPSYKIAPCDEHSTSSKNTNLIKTHFWRTQPPLMAPRLSSTRRAAVLQWAICCRFVSPHHPQQPGREAHRLIFSTEHYGATQHLVKQLLREVLQIWQPMQLPDHPPTASNTVPPQKKHPDCTMWRTFNFKQKYKFD